VDNLRQWFLQEVLPLWAAHGVDRNQGGFFEKLTSDLTPSSDHRRARLVARQIYFFASGAALGWHGPVDELINHGYSYLRLHLVTPEGNVRATCNSAGLIIDSRQHLYDVAFVLIALAKIVTLNSNHPEAEEVARQIAHTLTSDFTNPSGGYVDTISPGVQCANPHMHLFEAFLAWAELNRPDSNFWLQRANACAELALNRMILPDSGVLPEYYNHNWQPLLNDGILSIEPGHQFEWSWLLARWSALVDSRDAAIASERLCQTAETHGVIHSRNVVIESIDQFMRPNDFTSRLWQQTERVKAWHTQYLTTGSSNAVTNRDKALLGLQQFLAGPRPGMWFDTMNNDGTFVDEAVKASSGYHIACAIESISAQTR
jgi:mannose/cellobiose epimerase-like protein (N-acyl-D-glucosamine 2-epimerase family)